MRVGEFVELLNQSAAPVNLDRIELLYQTASGALEPQILLVLGVAPHSALVIYNNSVSETVLVNPTADAITQRRPFNLCSCQQ